MYFKAVLVLAVAQRKGKKPPFAQRLKHSSLVSFSYRMKKAKFQEEMTVEKNQMYWADILHLNW